MSFCQDPKLDDFYNILRFYWAESEGVEHAMEACDDDGYAEGDDDDDDGEVQVVAAEGEGEPVTLEGVDIFDAPLQESELARPGNDPIEIADGEPDGESNDKMVPQVNDVKPSPELPPQSRNNSHPVQTPEAAPSPTTTTPPVNKGSPDSMPPPPVPKKKPETMAPEMSREEALKRLEAVRCLVWPFVQYVFYLDIF